MGKWKQLLFTGELLEFEIKALLHDFRNTFDFVGNFTENGDLVFDPIRCFAVSVMFEMGVIDNAFAAEDYGRYIGAIDEFSESGAEKSISSAVELLGLDFGELGSIEQISFLKEYEKIDIDGILASARAGMDQPAGDLDILKRCTYIVSKKNSILEEERNSIEEDISARSAIVLEESVDELRNRLDDIRLRRSVSPEEGIQDISDSVIIIDNGRDIERFVESMPEGKRDIMRKLLKYLDGLFEKLPEDVIKNFAKSEYFDLYSKVMNDLGV